jgi:hypothetical protein
VNILGTGFEKLRTRAAAGGVAGARDAEKLHYIRVCQPRQRRHFRFKLLHLLAQQKSSAHVDASRWRGL